MLLIVWELTSVRLDGFDLNQLVCLDVLLRERNVSRAAEQVHISQSAMSWTLAQMREYFDDPLLVRAGRTLVLTPFATTLLGPVQEILTNAHNLLARTPGDARHKADRTIKVVASDYVVTVGLGAAVQTFMSRFPTTRYELLPLTVASSQLLANGEVDVVFAGQAMDVGSPPDAMVFEDQFACVVCQETCPGIKRMSKGQYRERQHIVLRYFEHQLAFEDEEALRRQGIARDRQVAVWSHALVPSLLLGTEMVATVAERAARLWERQWPVRVLPFPFPQEPMRMYAYWHASRREDALLQQFMDIARAAFVEVHSKKAR